MNCLITGGCGFIGRHFVKKMCDLNYNVDIVDNMVSKSSQYIDNWINKLKPTTNTFYFYEENILDFLQKNNKKYDIIIHCAAIVGGRETIENDPFLISYNITLDTELFKWMEKNPPNYFIYFSSSAVYPIHLQTHDSHRKLKLSDVDVYNNNIGIPDLTYGWSKLTGEFSLYLLKNKINTNISIYRPFSGYGEDQHESYPFPSIVKRISQQKNNIQYDIDIWSDSVRDFVYIDDIINFVLSTCYHCEGLKIQNIGSTIPTSISDLVKTVVFVLENSNHKKLNINVLNDKPKGVYYRVCDDKINNFTTTVEDGIKKMLCNMTY